VPDRTGFLGTREALTALDNIGHFVGLMTPDGTLIEANATALRAGGLTRNDVVGRPFWEAHWWSYDPGVQSQLCAAIERAAQGETVRYEVAVRAADEGRSLVVIDFQLTPVRDADGTVHFLVPEGAPLTDESQWSDEAKQASWAHLVAELDMVRTQSEALRSLASALARAPTVDDVAAAIAGAVAPTVGAVFGSVAVVSPDGAQLQMFMHDSVDTAMAARWTSVSVDGSTPLGYAVAKAESVHCADFDAIRATFPIGADDAESMGLQALAAYPVELDGRVLAAVGLAWDRPTAEPDPSMTAPVLALCGAALRRAWATDEAARVAALLDTLLREAPVGFAFIDSELRYSHVNARLAETNGLPIADHLGRRVRDVVPHLADQAEAALTEVLTTGTPLTGVEIVGETAAAPGVTRYWEEGFYPVEAPGVGIIGVGVVVVEVTAHRREQQALRQSVEHEREIARRLQRGLLPTSVPAVEGCEIAARYEAGTTGLSVGGDWYEVLEMAPDDIAVVVGDAVGHDLDAAIAMTQIRNALTGLSHATDDPATVLERLDEWAAHTPAVLASTLFYGRLHPTDGRLEYTLAGHHPPLVVHPDGTHDWFDADPGPPVGVTATRVTNVCPLRTGDLLVCYTDGLIEDRTEPIEAGRARLVDAAVALRDIGSLQELANTLLQRMLQVERPDDVVLLTLRRL
jgi:serine phosphatase RsbU (regulator of sigma subunit)/PAS domain-containing protein